MPASCPAAARSSRPRRWHTPPQHRRWPRRSSAPRSPSSASRSPSSALRLFSSPRFPLSFVVFLSLRLPACFRCVSLVSRLSRLLSFYLSHFAALPRLCFGSLTLRFSRCSALPFALSFCLSSRGAPACFLFVSPSALPLAFVLSPSSRGAPACFRFISLVSRRSRMLSFCASSRLPGFFSRP